MSCPPCTNDCNQGRDCLLTKNSDDSDSGIVMIERPWQWIGDVFYTAVYIGGAVVIGVAFLVIALWVTGLHRVIF